MRFLILNKFKIRFKKILIILKIFIQKKNFIKNKKDTKYLLIKFNCSLGKKVTWKASSNNWFDGNYSFPLNIFN